MFKLLPHYPKPKGVALAGTGAASRIKFAEVYG
jgi:hypothetical protein